MGKPQWSNQPRALLVWMVCSPALIALAKTRHPDVTFHYADVCAWTPSRQYSFITAWDSIWHVPQDRHASVVRKLCKALTPGGVFIWTTGGVDQPGEKRDSHRVRGRK